MQLLNKVMIKYLLRFVEIKLVFKLTYSWLFKVVNGFIFFYFHNVKISTSTFFGERVKRKNLKSIDIKFEMVKTVRSYFFFRKRRSICSICNIIV